MTLILGSQSPRRKEILSFFALPFEQQTPSFDEEAVPFQGNPMEYAHILSKGKADSLFTQFPDRKILTADTIVYFQGKVYGKPQSEEQAYLYLKDLCGHWHTVYTSLTVRYREKEHQMIEATRVHFNALTDEEMHLYYRKLHYADKAGGYSIQQAGSLIVKEIVGCYYNVMGLPINALRQVLLHVDIDLWHHLA
jgi:septum formation protein